MARRNTPKKPIASDDFIGPQEPHSLTLIPFPGFYESWLSGDIDSHEEQEAEQFAEKEEGGYQGTEYPETLQPEHQRLDASEFHELFMKHMDYGELHRLLADCWCDQLAITAAEFLGFPLHLKFESMDSPSYYNFETDRAFAHIPVRIVKQLIRYTLRSKASRDTLRQRIEERHASRSGFASWYSTNPAEWAARMRAFLKDAESDMDHNHLQTILEAAIMHAYPGGSKRDHKLSAFQWEVYENYANGDGIYYEWDQSMDWAAFDKECAELRQEKDDEFREQNPEQEPPPAL